MIAQATCLMAKLGANARKSSVALRRCSTREKQDALRLAASEIAKDRNAILAANELDMATARKRGLSCAFLDRLELTPERVAAIATLVEKVASLPDPVGIIIKRWKQPNGLEFERVRVPIGVIGVIYESRPNVTAEAAALCLMSSNAVILRGGSEAMLSNRSIHGAFVRGIQKTGICKNSVQLVTTKSRAMVGAMFASDYWLDLLIPRGGPGLLERVTAEARVPTLGHFSGNCHIYVDRSANAQKAIALVTNSKMRRPGVCGAAETLLLDSSNLALAKIVVCELLDSGCSVRGDSDTSRLDARVESANEADWETEYLAPVIAAKFVDGVDAAIDHIGRYGSGHTDCIVTECNATASRFLNDVDSAIVIHNASTQFADGAEFGFGAEIGIATGRLHARGPVGLEELTTFKTVVKGAGQVRE
jgi:glutamate-5-semialdehyde dehydrogenase